MTTTTVYYRLRITLDDETPTEFSDKILDKIIRDWGLITLHWWDYLGTTGFIYDKATCGFESKDKCGALCRPHFHIHFNSRAKKDTIVHALKREYLEYHGLKLKGNNMYALKIDPFPENDAKFFSYPMKQGGFYKYLGFEEDEIAIFRGAGAQMYASTCEINAKRSEHREEANTLFDRLFETLSCIEDRMAEPKDVVEFYMNENRPLNNTVLKGYWSLYLLKCGRMTSTEYALKYMD